MPPFNTDFLHYFVFDLLLIMNMGCLGIIYDKYNGMKITINLKHLKLYAK